MLNIEFLGTESNYQGGLIFGFPMATVNTSTEVVLVSLVDPSNIITLTGEDLDFTSMTEMTGSLTGIAYTVEGVETALWTGLEWDAADLAGAIADAIGGDISSFHALISSQDIHVDATNAMGPSVPGPLPDGFVKKYEFDGSSFSDKAFGGGGRDLLKGNSGNDKLFGGGSKDRIEGGTGRDTLKGDGGADRLAGGKGNDKMFGGNGSDRLDGGKGSDVMVGGKGADTFVFKGTSGNDVIKDFNNGVDIMSVFSATFEELDIDQSGADTVISWDDNSITLRGETGTIDADDFLFAGA